MKVLFAGSLLGLIPARSGVLAANVKPVAFDERLIIMKNCFAGLVACVIQKSDWCRKIGLAEKVREGGMLGIS